MLSTDNKGFPVLGALFTVLAVTVPHTVSAERLPDGPCACAEDGKKVCGPATGSRNLSVGGVNVSGAGGGTRAGVNAAVRGPNEPVAGSEGSPGPENLEGPSGGGGDCISIGTGQKVPL